MNAQPVSAIGLLFAWFCVSVMSCNVMNDILMQV